jgi:asparagine synthase (glutamine-hydrolysing)
MCAIVGMFNLRPDDDLAALRRRALECSRRQRHRGPDWNGIYADDGAILVHERLAIIDPSSGAQPLRSSDGELVLAVNGEIYNHIGLRAGLRSPYRFMTGSDCEVINALYREDDPGAFLQRINGIFAFALWDRSRRHVLIARDPIGVCPLYWGHDSQGRLWVASEMKALLGSCADVSQFPPGHYYLGGPEGGECFRYYQRPWREYDNTRDKRVSADEIRSALERAVSRQMMSDVPYGVLLSGGLDSSAVAACVIRGARRADPHGSAPRVDSFAIGLSGSPDLAAASLAAEQLGTVHHGFEFTLEQGLDALRDVIWHIESYDVTTVRASTPMYLLARRIKSMGFKMVLSGEGADEAFGGYLYFHKAPSAREFHDETVRKLDALHVYDCLRANKSLMAWGVEARVPFLDVEFLEVAMGLDAKWKMVGEGRMEKFLLRKAFEGLIPEAIVWRQKEQLSDGVGYAWIDALKAYADARVSDSDMSSAATRFPVNPPASKEAYLYRAVFEECFPGSACAATVPGGKSIACSSAAAIAWDASFADAADPSGRAVAGVHKAAGSLGGHVAVRSERLYGDPSLLGSVLSERGSYKPPR